MLYLKNSRYWLTGFTTLLFFLIVIPANADDATVSLPPLNPSPLIESAPGGLPQMEAGEQLPSFDQPNINVFKDPQGKYTITFPQGTTQQQGPDDNIVAFSLPDQAKAYIPMVTNPEANQEAFLDIEDDILGQGGSKVGQSVIQVGNRTAQVNLYGMEGSALSDMTGEEFSQNLKYAIVMVLYPNTNLMTLIILPKDAYNNAQPWILETIKGVIFQ
ncbi:hypothetical protein [Atribacter laminatus]|uniref:PsbP C-terminal domain-containing protein n=1 Tax=Atribacter laminatus TaxID=2847778 RepID=A0A7T1F359_ATRLM|nr:hypothetical protein [Atribacter laminatus]QPM68050.1 hypothetical protein RT761_01264 [Atribacter laminatus]